MPREPIDRMFDCRADDFDIDLPDCCYDDDCDDCEYYEEDQDEPEDETSLW